MANVANNVLVGVSGTQSSAPLGTTLPTDATTALSGSYLDNGYISDDGVTLSINTDTTDITAWGGDVVRTIQTSHSVQLQYTMIETKDSTQSEFFGDSAFATGLVTVRAAQLPYKVRVLDVLDGTARLRLVAPNSQIVDRGDIVFKTDSAIGYNVTVQCYGYGALADKLYIYESSIPVGSTTAAPLVTAASPTSTGVAGGGLITITGSGFTTVTGAGGVKFGGTNATNYAIVNDNKIVATAPAKTAGSQPITVTNPSGTSNSLAFTYV